MVVWTFVEKLVNEAPLNWQSLLKTLKSVLIVLVGNKMAATWKTDNIYIGHTYKKNWKQIIQREEQNG